MGHFANRQGYLQQFTSKILKQDELLLSVCVGDQSQLLIHQMWVKFLSNWLSHYCLNIEIVFHMEKIRNIFCIISWVHVLDTWLNQINCEQSSHILVITKCPTKYINYVNLTWQLWNLTNREILQPFFMSYKSNVFSAISSHSVPWNMSGLMDISQSKQACEKGASLSWHTSVFKPWQ